MIIDDIEHSHNYLAIHPLFETAFRFITENDLNTFEPGRYELQGDDLYAIIAHEELRLAENAPLETHDLYIDIQYCIANSEAFGWSPKASLEVSEPYDNQRDIAFYAPYPMTQFTLTPGRFAVFFPQDGHAPLIGKGKVKKCILKVRQ